MTSKDSVELDRMLARIERDTENWLPKPGEVLVGTVLEVSEFDGGWGLYPIVTVETKDGTPVAFHAFHTVPKNEIVRQQPVPGDTFAAKYFGIVKGKNDREFEKYRVIVQKPAGSEKQVDWAGMASSEELPVEAEPPQDVVTVEEPVGSSKKKTAGQSDEIPF